MNRIVVAAAAIVGWHLAPWGVGAAFAELQAHLQVVQISNIAAVSTTDGNDHPSENGGANLGEEPFWQMAILDDVTVTASETSEFTSSTEPGCSNWDVTSTLVVNQELVRTVPDQTEAAFYIGVFDYDVFLTNNTPATFLSESLGDHFWSGAVDASVVAVANNNQSPFHFDADGLLCGRAASGVGIASNWQAKFRSWYTDTDGPSAATALVHADASAPEGINDDSQMVFEWMPGGDPDSGSSQVLRIDRQSDSASCEHSLASTDSSFAFSVGAPLSCDAGGTLGGSSMPLAEGESYTALVRTRNGSQPEIENQASVDSAATPPILQQGLATLLFEDEFESGDTSAWSSTSDG